MARGIQHENQNGEALRAPRRPENDKPNPLARNRASYAKNTLAA